MYRPKSIVSKVALSFTFLGIVALIFTTFILTDNMISGEQNMVEEELLDPLTSTIGDLLDGEVRSTNYPPD